MAIKIFCSVCEEFIRPAMQAEISELTGREVCQKCKGFSAEAIAEIDKKRNRAIHQMNLKADKAIADIQEIMRRVIKGEEE